MRTLNGVRVLCLAAGVSGLACGRHADPEKHLVPQGYIGHVYIVFDATDGVPPEHDGTARVYRIPAGGILRTQFPPNDGWSWKDEVQFFSVDAVGRPTRLRSAREDTVAMTEPVVFGPSVGAVAAPVPGTDNQWSTEAPCTVRFSSYYVGSWLQVKGAGDGSDRLHEYLADRPLPCNRATHNNQMQLTRSAMAHGWRGPRS
jgi:hypothetical protein